MTTAPVNFAENKDYPPGPPHPGLISSGLAVSPSLDLPDRDGFGLLGRIPSPTNRHRTLPSWD